ncbi:MAG: 30S ribosomal protein S27ae [Euryarchaeota archaeon]|nr:30S ribosomal protein S27ae [Euryarchaeota archaeon]MBK70161.1 30S ribosomal protein S27ae [Euryarchaeota archaeon]
MPQGSPNGNAKHSKYSIDGDQLVRGESCPNCGPGVFLAVHSDRKSCGKCGHSVKA